MQVTHTDHRMLYIAQENGYEYIYADNIVTYNIVFALLVLLILLYMYNMPQKYVNVYVFSDVCFKNVRINF